MYISALIPLSLILSFLPTSIASYPYYSPDDSSLFAREPDADYSYDIDSIYDALASRSAEPEPEEDEIDAFLFGRSAYAAAYADADADADFDLEDIYSSLATRDPPKRANSAPAAGKKSAAAPKRANSAPVTKKENAAAKTAQKVGDARQSKQNHVPAKLGVVADLMLQHEKERARAPKLSPASDDRHLQATWKFDDVAERQRKAAGGAKGADRLVKGFAAKLAQGAADGHWAKVKASDDKPEAQANVGAMARAGIKPLQRREPVVEGWEWEEW